MARDIEYPVEDEYGAERHPAFGLIGVSRVSTTGSILFDSDIVHQHTVMVRIKAASRKRDLHRDWIHGREEYIEVEMSEAQWASFVSSMNSGDGVPCTVRAVDNQMVPGMTLQPRLAQSMQETHDAAQRAFEDIQVAMAAYEQALADKAPAAVRKDALGTLRARINNAVPNVDFAGKALAEQAEDVVTKARADIEAFVVNKAHQLGLDPGDIAASSPFALGAGPQEDEDA